MKLLGRNLFVKMDQLKEGAAGGAPAVPPAATPPAAAAVVQPKAGEQSQPPASAAKAQGEGDKFDEFGYEKTAPAKAGQPAAAAKPPEPKAEPKAIENPATGYGAPIKVDEEEIPPVPPVAPVPIDLGYELNVEGLVPEQAQKLIEFAKKYSLSKEAAQARVDEDKALNKAAADIEAAAVKEAKIARQRLHASWDKELRADPNFGGEHFDANVQRAERVLQEFMPNTKKELTSRKVMPAPYIMRDLAALADTLFATERLVHGEPPAPPPVVAKPHSPLDYYDNPQPA